MPVIMSLYINKYNFFSSSPSRTSSEGDPAASNDPQNQPLNQFLIPSAVIQLLRNDSSTRIPLNESAARILLQVI